VDRAAALERVGGDRELLKELVDLFREDCPRALQEIEDALAQGNARQLQQAAHGLKGSVGIFGATATVAAAQRLESIGQSGDLTGAAEAYDALQVQLRRLDPALDELVNE
jgi:HPt (histidine-containing phosphotransfer) domain-containing protein